MNQNPTKIKIFINGRFLTQSLTGVQRYAHELINTFESLLKNNYPLIKNYEFILLLPKSNILHQLHLKNITFKQIGFFSGHFWEQLILPFYVKKNILFCPGNTAPILTLLFTKTTIVTIHDLSFKYFPYAYNFSFKIIYKLLTPLIIKFAAKIITVSNSEKNSIIKNYPRVKNRIYAIQNGGFGENYMTTTFPNKNSASQFEIPMILYVGSLNPRKNIEGLIKSLMLLNESRQIKAVIVGASSKSFRVLNKDLIDKTNKLLEFKGQIENTEELIKLYQKATCFVFPSFYEASPLPPVEAMACGCPVIASKIPSLEERCGDAALYCKAEDIHDIAEKIKMVLNDENLRQELIQKGIERAKIYTWKKCTTQTLEIIHSVTLNKFS